MSLDLRTVQEEEAEEEDPRGAIVHEHPLFEGISEEFLGGVFFSESRMFDGNLRVKNANPPPKKQGLLKRGGVPLDSHECCCFLLNICCLLICFFPPHAFKQTRFSTSVLLPRLRSELMLNLRPYHVKPMVSRGPNLGSQKLHPPNSTKRETWFLVHPRLHLIGP